MRSITKDLEDKTAKLSMFLGLVDERREAKTIVEQWQDA